MPQALHICLAIRSCDSLLSSESHFLFNLETFLFLFGIFMSLSSWLWPWVLSVDSSPTLANAVIIPDPQVFLWQAGVDVVVSNGLKSPVAAR